MGVHGPRVARRQRGRRRLDAAMDIARPVQTSPLQIECPHCGQVEDDDYESIDSNLLIDVRCSECRRTYAIAVMECSQCCAECLFAWMQRPSPVRFAELRCQNCSHGYDNHETLSTSTTHTA